MQKIKILFFLFWFVFPFLVKSAIVPCGGPNQEPCTLCHFFVLFKNIVDFFIKPPGGLIYPIGIFMIVLAGFMFIIGHYEEKADMISQARTLLRSVVIGFFIILSAWVVVNLFFQVIGVAEWTGLKEGWWKIECP